MSQWRRIAIEKVPALKSDIETANNPMALWLELHFALEVAYRAKPPDEATIQQIFEYALWCLQDKNQDIIQAVLCAFFEHLPLNGTVRRDLPQRLSFSQFEELKPAFHYFLDDQEFEKFVTEFLDHKDAKERRHWELQQNRVKK